MVALQPLAPLKQPRSRFRRRVWVRELLNDTSIWLTRVVGLDQYAAEMRRGAILEE